jgi:tetratricopeptide (TPR) repeat protein
LSALEAAIRALEKSPDVRLRACNKLIEVTGSLVKRRSGDRTLKGALASALVYKGFTLGRLGRSEEEIAVYDQVVQRFGKASEPVLRQHVAQALVNKGVALAGQLHRYQEAMTVFEDVVKRFGEAPEPVLRWLVVIALYLKGAVLVRLARFEEATAVYDEVLRRFGDASEAGAREIAAIAMGKAAESGIRSAKRTWRQGGEPQARQYLVDAKVRLNHVLAGGRHEAKMLAAAGYTAFLLDETAEAEAHISEALRLDAEEARAYLLELTGFEALPKDEQFKDWLETLGG